MTRTRCLSLAFLVAMASPPWPAFAGKFNDTVSVGDVGPTWRDLAGTDGKKHGFDDLKEAKAIVVIFTGNHCPIAAMYEPRIVELTKEFSSKGVAVVAINVCKVAGNDLDQMKARAEKSGFNFQYVADPSQKSGRAYGATSTPHVFLLDSKRKIAYMGAIDDNVKAEAVKRRFLRDAIEMTLSGKTPEVTETRPRGCHIEYDQ